VVEDRLMPLVHLAQTNFNSGTLSQRGAGRVDLARYRTSGSEVKNFLPTVLGPIVKRSGTRYQSAVKYGDKNTRLIEFEPGIGVSYMVEVGDLYMRVHYENATPVLEEDLSITSLTVGTFTTIEVTGHSLSDGDHVWISGMADDRLNGQFLVANVSGNSFDLETVLGNNINSTDFNTGISGATAGKYLEIVTTYTEDEIDDIQVEQSIDVMFMVHQSHPVATLSRTTVDTFVLADYVFDWPAMLDQNSDDTHTLTASTTTGTITVTSSVSMFDSTYLGMAIQINELVESKNTTWDVGKTIAIGNSRKYNGNLYRAETAGTTGTNPPVHLQGVESDGGVDWLYLHSGEGYGIITAVNSDTEVELEVIKRIPYSAVSDGTYRWQLGAWNERHGYPRALCFHDLRLYLAGTSHDPQTIWASAVDEFADFQRGTDADRPFVYTLNTKQNNTIQWIETGTVLAIGTSRNEFIAHGSRVEDAITTEDVRSSRQTSIGSSAARPVVVGSTILFVERRGLSIREYLYDFNIDKYRAGDLTLLSEGVITSGIEDIAFQQIPNNNLWIRDGGTLKSLIYDQNQEAVGLFTYEIGGSPTVISIAVASQANGLEDKLWMINRRTIDGQTVQYIEWMESQFSINGALTDARMLDCFAYRESETTTNTVTGLWHLEGETLTLVGDGAVMGQQATVSGGTVTFPREYSKRLVGYPYTSVFQTNRPEAGMANGSAIGAVGQMFSVTLRLLDTGPGLWFGEPGKLEEINFRNTSDAMNEPVGLRSTDMTVTHPTGVNTDQILRIEHKLATPCTLMALVSSFDKVGNR
jgi:hypothetical protein